MQRNGFSQDITTLCFVIVGSCIFGFAFDALAICIIIGLLGYILWMLRSIQSLSKWVLALRRRRPRASPLTGGLGDIVDDVSRIQKRYNKEKSRLRAVVNRVQEMTAALTDGVVLLDKHENIEWWNRAAEDLFGLKRVDLGHKLTNLIRHPDFVKYYDGGDYSMPLSLYSAQWQNRHLQFQIHPFGNGERLVIVRDVTRVSKLEEMRRDFVANVSHELRTPLTVIVGYLETLSDIHSSADDDSKQNQVTRQALSQMQDQCEHMTALVHDLITLTKLETEDQEIRQEVINVDQLLNRVIKEAAEMSGDRRHMFDIHIPKVHHLRGNPQELYSAFSNILFNAVKYSPPSTSIRITCTLSAVEFTVKIRDKGKGIDPKHIPRLTERFYRVDGGRNSKTGGTGLGLAIVKHVLLRHNADLSINSQLGKGSTFRCIFPLSRYIRQETS